MVKNQNYRVGFSTPSGKLGPTYDQSHITYNLSTTEKSFSIRNVIYDEYFSFSLKKIEIFVMAFPKSINY